MICHVGLISMGDLPFSETEKEWMVSGRGREGPEGEGGGETG